MDDNEVSIIECVPAILIFIEEKEKSVRGAIGCSTSLFLERSQCALYAKIALLYYIVVTRVYIQVSNY